MSKKSTSYLMVVKVFFLSNRDMTREKLVITLLSFCLFVNSRFPKDIQEHLYVAVVVDGLEG